MTHSPSPSLSVVFPVYNEQGNLESLVAEIEAALVGEDYEILAIDDGSTDGSLDELARLAQGHSRLRFASLGSRRGQSAALVSAFDRARGHLIVTMDGDGQNDPRDVPRLLQAVRDGACDAAVGYRLRRADGAWKRVQASVANAVRNWVTGDRVRDTGCSLRVATREAFVDLPRFDGMHRFIPTLLRLRGANVGEYGVGHRPRQFGRSKYGMLDRVFVGMRDALAVRRMRKKQLAVVAKKEARTDDEA